jgi:hypothetical protein
MFKMLRMNHRLTCNLQISRMGGRVGSLLRKAAPAGIKRGLKLFYARARRCSDFIPPAGPRAKRAFLAANKLFNCLS